MTTLTDEAAVAAMRADTMILEEHLDVEATARTEYFARLNVQNQRSWAFYHEG